MGPQSLRCELGAAFWMLTVDTIAKIRRAFFVEKKPIMDRMRFYAVTRAIEIASEAARRLPPGIACSPSRIAMARHHGVGNVLKLCGPFLKPSLSYPCFASMPSMAVFSSAAWVVTIPQRMVSLMR